MKTKILTTFSEFYQCKELYNDILSKMDFAWEDVYLSYEWHKIWLESHKDSLSPFIVAIYDNDILLAIFPLCVRKEKIKNFCFLRTGYVGAKDANYSQFLIARDADKKEVFNEFFKTLREIWQKKWFFLTLPVLCSDSLETGIFLEALKSSCFWAEINIISAPFIKIEGDEQWYVNNYIKKKLRKDLIRQENNAVKEFGDIKIEIAGKSDLEYFFEMHIKEWQSRGEKSRYLDAGNREFEKRLLSDFEFIDFVKLKFGEQVVAYHMGYRYNGHFYYRRPTFDLRFAHLSPGKLLLAELIKREIRQGTKIFDLGRGSNEYKYWFGKEELPLVAIRIYKSRILFLISKAFQFIRKF
jgi:hypothetical protein